MDINNLDFQKNDGLIPAIVQDANNARVLMLGYMNRESIEKTIETGYVTFFSRSHEELWTKGETSGNYLKFEDVQADCDNDTLLITAHPHGPVCHTGNESCFYEKPYQPPESQYGFLGYLEDLLKQRYTNRPENSYTTKLFDKGLDKITQKVGEEAIETVIASKNQEDEEFIYEASDLLFHLMVLLVERGVPFEELISELENRHRE